MAIESYIRGHKVYYDVKEWRFKDNNKLIDENITCKRCGRKPTKEGYDACLGYVEGATSACCGHGVEEGFVLNK